MGLFEKLRAELIDIVEWVDDSRHTLVWRFPRFHNQIKWGSQLIVRPGQSAVFVHQGKIADVFGPGQYRLETKNLPILSTLAGWPYGFDSPFKAEVYFVSTRQIADCKWGTPNPVLIRDPDFGPIRVRAFGTYTLRAQEPKRLLEELVGTDAVFESEEVAVLLRSIIANAFSDLVANADLSVVDLAANYRELSEKLRQLVLERVDDEYGLDLPQLWIVNVSVPEEVPSGRAGGHDDVDHERRVVALGGLGELLGDDAPDAHVDGAVDATVGDGDGVADLGRRRRDLDQVVEDGRRRGARRLAGDEEGHEGEGHERSDAHVSFLLSNASIAAHEPGTPIYGWCNNFTGPRRSSRMRFSIFSSRAARAITAAPRRGSPSTPRSPTRRAGTLKAP
jgi:hypothetical protein